MSTNNLNIIEALQAHAETFETSYLLAGRMMYPDEIFCAEGFMPLIGRMAERRLRRNLNNPDMNCGFSYVPLREGVFKEALMILPERDPMVSDSMCLAALRAACVDVVGMGVEGTLDLTPVFEFFTGTKPEQRNAMRQQSEEPITWPLYQPVRVQ